jgi:Gamma-glutamyltransferase
MFKAVSTRSRQPSIDVDWIRPHYLDNIPRGSMTVDSGRITLHWNGVLSDEIPVCEVQYVGLLHSNVDTALGTFFFVHREIFFTPDSGSALGAGSWVKPSPKLCDTLKTIAQKGVFEFYEGVLGDDFVLDVREMGGNLTRNDLKKYRWVNETCTFFFSGRLFNSSYK